MKIKFEYGDEEVEIPKVFLDGFKQAKKEEKDLTIEEYFDELDYDNYSEYYGKIVDKEMALFLIAKELGTDYGFGGYPREEYMNFEDNGFKYTICCFGWANDENLKSGGYNFIGYKEKISFVTNKEIKIVEDRISDICGGLASLAETDGTESDAYREYKCDLDDKKLELRRLKYKLNKK